MRENLFSTLDDAKPEDREEYKAYDRYVSWLVRFYDLSKIPHRILVKRINHLTNCLDNCLDIQDLQKFPIKRWERLQYNTFRFKNNKPVEFKKKWLRTVPRKKFTFIHELTDRQYYTLPYRKNGLNYSIKRKKFEK